MAVGSGLYEQLLEQSIDVPDYPIFKACVFGIDDFKKCSPFLRVWRRQNRVYKDPYSWEKLENIDDAIKHHKAAPFTFITWTWRNDLNRVDCHIINSFLTENIYTHKSIKYSNIIQNHQYSTFTEFREFLQYGTNPWYNNNHNNNDHDDEEKEQKYSNNDQEEHKQDTLRTKHIMAADAFMIVYDIRYQKELDKVRQYLDEIFEMKGYDKLLEKVRNDEMCLFPISLIGVNWDKTTDQNNKISRAQINEIAMKYCVNVDWIEIFVEVGANRGYYDEKSAEIRSFTNNVLDYYYYESLSDDRIKSLKATKNNECFIL